MSLAIRPAPDDDAAAIADIYNTPSTNTVYEE